MKKSQVRGKDFEETENTSDSAGQGHDPMTFAQIRRLFLSSVS